MDFVSYFRDHIENFAEIAKPVTDLTGKTVPSKIPWGEEENKAFEELTAQLCQATMEPMQIVDFNKPYVIEIDSSNSTIGAVLLQTVKGQRNKPVAFASQKLTTTQRSQSTIEKEAFAAIWSLD